MVKDIITLSGKDTIKQEANKIIQEIVNGDRNPKEAYIALSAMQKTIETVLKDDYVRGKVVQIVENSGGSIETKNYTIQSMEAGVRYDYSDCNDTVIDDLYDRQKALENEIKEREKFLKGLVSPFTIVDEDTGEIKKIYPPSKVSTTTVKITFKK